MKRTTGILVCTLAVGMAWAQNPQIIQNTRAQLNTVQQNNTAASNDALGIKQVDAKTTSAKSKQTTAPVKSSAPAVKTVSASAKSDSAGAKAAAKPSAAAVKVVAASPKSSKTVSVSAAPVKSAAVKPQSASASASKSATPFNEKKPASTTAKAQKIDVKQVAAKKPAKPAAASKKTAIAAAPSVKSAPSAPAPAGNATDASASTTSEEGKGEDDAVKDAQEKKWSMSGKRDPFISPVVSHSGGSGCSTGKKCLEIGDINLRGVVHSDGGFIAVVTNNLNKAYFLRENDPVFDGYVVKITGDSIIFKETLQDRLGKSFTREVTKKITTPAV